MDIGVLVDETTVLPMRTVGTGTNEQHASVVLDLKHRVLQVYFRLPVFNSLRKTVEIHYSYRLTVPFAQMKRIFQKFDSVSKSVSHLTFLDAPPVYHRRIQNISSTFLDENSWKDADTWFRQTDIAHNQQDLAALPVGLRKYRPLIDIGEAHTSYYHDFTGLMFFCRSLECLQYNVSAER